METKARQKEEKVKKKEKKTKRNQTKALWSVSRHFGGKEHKQVNNLGGFFVFFWYRMTSQTGFPGFAP